MIRDLMRQRPFDVFFGLLCPLPGASSYSSGSFKAQSRFSILPDSRLLKARWQVSSHRALAKSKSQFNQ